MFFHLEFILVEGNIAFKADYLIYVDLEDFII